MELIPPKFGISYGSYSACTPKEANLVCHKGAIMVDIREDYLTDYKQFDVKEILYCPNSELKELYVNLPKEKRLIIADATGLFAKDAVLFLQEKGYQNIFSLAGGFIEWEHDKLPIRTDLQERLTGSCACMLRPRERKNK